MQDKIRREKKSPATFEGVVSHDTSIFLLPMRDSNMAQSKFKPKKLYLMQTKSNK